MLSKNQKNELLIIARAPQNEKRKLLKINIMRLKINSSVLKRNDIVIILSLLAAANIFKFSGFELCVHMLMRSETNICAN